MVGFTLLSRADYYLRRRSPGPPFPPDHRQAGERGAKKSSLYSRSLISIHKVYSTITPQAQQRLYKAAPCVSYACGGLL